MTTTKIPTGRFVWFEYMGKDLKKAQGFFGELFNWTTQAVPSPHGEYTMIAAGDATIGGYVPHKPGAPDTATWLAHLQVENAAATVEKIKSLGGKLRMGPNTLGDFGTFAVVTDPLDGAFCLWQPGKPEGTGDYKGQTGTFCWNELVSSDPAKSAEFYKAIGGFDVKSMDMPGMGTYTTLESDGKPRAGVVKPPMDGVPQMWTPYVQVTNADQTAEKAKKLGATILVPPTSVPTVGRFAILSDPQGGVIGILQP